MKISQAMEEFLIDQQIKGNTEKTQRYYRGSIGVFIAHTQDMPLEDVTLSDLKAYSLYLLDSQRSTTTVQTYVRALRAFLTWGWQEGYTSENLSQKYRLPKAKKHTVDVLTDSEIKALMSCFNTRDTVGLRNYCICSLMLDAGLRLSEAASLDMGKMHLPEGFIIVNGKGNKERIVPIGLNTKKYMMKYQSKRSEDVGHSFFFLQVNTTPLKSDTVAQLFRKLKKRSGIQRLKAHLLRHTFATRYLENGGDIYSLQLILGHTSLEMVKRYIHTTPRKIVGKYANFSPMDNLGKHEKTP